jgi:uncharacterized protein YqfA (UPF0365 family)
VSATLASSAHHQHTLQQPEAFLLTGLSAGLQDGLIFKFLGAATADAHQMVMIAMGFTRELEPAAALWQFQLLKQTHRGEQPQGAINSGQGNALVFAQQPLVHLFGTEVASAADALEQGQHPLPLGSEAVAAVVQAVAQGRRVPGLG